MTKRFFLLLLIALTLMLSAALAEDAFPLEGTWRFCGGAEVCGYGFTLREDGVCTLYNTDDYESFPPERLISRDVDCVWRVVSNEDGAALALRFTASTATFPLTLLPAAEAERGVDTLHLAEGDGGGFYERCEEGFVVPMHHAVPDEVAEHIAAWYPDGRLLDYLDVSATPGGDYAFALVENGSVRILMGYQFIGGKLENWLDSEFAIPQSDLPARLYCYERSAVYDKLWTDGEYRSVTAGPSVGVYTTDGESMIDFVMYEWQGDGFYLTEYKRGGYTVNLIDDQLVFFNIGDGYNGTLTHWVQRDIRLADFRALPRSMDEARAGSNSDANADEPPFEGYDSAHALIAHDLPFNEDERYYVYIGPGKSYGRSGNGKAAVSTNDWIQVFGEYNGWLLIQYGIDDERWRIGWITANALPDGVKAPALRFMEDDWCTLSEAWALTDDPLRSHTSLVKLPVDAEVLRLAWLNEDWTYVRVKHKGKTWWGFVPSALIGHG